VIKAIEDFKLIERANHIGAILRQGLLGLMARHEIIGEVRGRGLVLGIDLVQDRRSRQPVPVQTTAKVIYRAYQLGAIFFYVGIAGNVLEFTPPLTLTEAEAAEGLAIIDQALTDVGNGMVSDAEVAPFIMW
jgi:4-aminobutyrate aminotransferase